jgi:hypothetical protein
MTTSNYTVSRAVKALAGGALCIAVLGTGSMASADSTCNTLLSTLRSELTNCPGCVTAHHTTNFITVSGGFITSPRFGGYTDFSLSLVNGHIVGSGSRLHSDRSTSSGQPFDATQGEAISYDIDPSGKLTMDGQYGPFDPICYFDQFMLIPGAAVIEAFSFNTPFIR